MLRFLVAMLLVSLAVLVIHDVVLEARRGVPILRDITVGRTVVTQHSTIYPIDYPQLALGVVFAGAGAALLVTSIESRRRGRA